MNALDQDITGKVVVITKEVFPSAYQALPYRLFRVTGGNGAQPHTIGRKIFGEFLLKPGRYPMWTGDTEDVHYGFEVERLATEEDMQALEHIRQLQAAQREDRLATER